MTLLGFLPERLGCIEGEQAHPALLNNGKTFIPITLLRTLINRVQMVFVL
jgi:hypothetical protein